MSYQGQSPKVNRLRLQPRSADPDLPTEGDLQYADGTARAKGVWIYKNGAWTSVVDEQGQAVKLRFVPQSADPASPQTGDVFYADGTSRAAGLWLYQNSTWVFLSGNTYQDIAYKKIFNVRLASGTATNYSLAALIPGSTFDGLTLVAGDFILLKSQTTSSENGVYVVAASGPAFRHADFDTAAKLSYAAIAVEDGSVANKNKCFVQSKLLASLSDAQVWDEQGSANAQISFIVPQGLTSIDVIGSGGGSGGGAGGAQFNGGGAGAGGGGAIPLSTSIAVTAGESLTISLGTAGRGGLKWTGGPLSATNAGTSGGDTIIYRGANAILRMPGATNPGTYGNLGTGGAASAVAVSGLYSPLYMIGNSSGAGGNGGPTSGQGVSGGNTQSAFSTASGGYGGSVIDTQPGGGGGAGGSGFTAGGRGGHGGGASSSLGSVGSWVGPGSTVTRTSNTTTITVQTALLAKFAAVPVVPGDRLILSGFTPASFNGTWTVQTVGTGSFTVYNPGPDGSASVLGTCNQSTPGHNGTYGSGGGGGGGGSGNGNGIYEYGNIGGWGGLGFVRFIW